jgi:L-2-hydroxyglutarate oxidase
VGIKNTDIVIIGAGILGTTLSYIISSLSNAKIVLLDQENKVAYHASSRNTGKVHAPFIYDPVKKRVFAKAALFGYMFWSNYCNAKKICFKEDGILEVATDAKSIDTLYKHFKWGIDNGLEKKDIQILEKRDVEKIEPSIRCQKAILCKKDASVDYGEITNSLAIDAIKNKVDVVLQAKVNNISMKSQLNNKISINYKQYPKGNTENEIKCDF